MSDLDRVQIALLVIASLMFLESTIGILAPAFVKRMGEGVTKATGKTSPVFGTLLLIVAVFLWALILAGLSLDRWVLLFVSIVIAALGHSCLRQGALQNLVRAMLVDRSVLFVRVLYIVELTFGGLILWVALFRGDVGG